MIPWKSQQKAFSEGLDYLTGRLKGEIQSIKTPWEKFNDAATDGLEWNTITVIGARPATGKTLLVEQIVRNSFKLNRGQTFRVLQFQFEMLGRTQAIREFSGETGLSYKALCNADKTKPMTHDIIKRCTDYASSVAKYPIDIIDEPCSVDQFVNIIRKYFETYSYELDGKKQYTKTIITVDHTLLFKDNDKNTMLYYLGEKLTELKKIYPVMFIVLSQLNRNVENPDRLEEGKYGNYIISSDIFGADALNQHADLVVGLNRPGKQKIKFYGPDRYIIEDENTLVFHFLKCRNGDTRMSFFKAEFEKMSIAEMDTPPQQKSLRTR
jgi:replicative DNA helicase